ncbi:hypothetical protein ACE6H2_014292 [Prunus campanulata]
MSSTRCLLLQIQKKQWWRKKKKKKRRVLFMKMIAVKLLKIPKKRMAKKLLVMTMTMMKKEEEDGIVCAICKSTDGDASDPIVFCDGCDLMVHATCYGDPLVKGIPEGDWFCTQCSLSSVPSQSNEPSSCCLCPIKGGAMKATRDGRWAHIVCALYVPEVFFKDPEGREGIDCSKVPKRRWKERCYVCKSSRGCAIQCSELKCPLAFHVTCGLNEDLCLEYREGRKQGAIVAGFCKTHSDLWKKQEQTGKYKIVARED